MNANVLNTIKKSAAVPSVPQVVLRLLEIMQDPNFEYRDLVKVVSTDAGTVSEVLRLANSSLFGVRNKIVSLQHGLTLLGPKRVRSLLLGRYLIDSMSRKQVYGLDMNYFWRRSLASSVLAGRLAETLAPHYRDEAFICALLADIGVPILCEAFPEAYAPIFAQYAPHGTPVDPEQELEAVEVTHAEVSAMVLSHWRLPEDVTNAVNLHHSENPGEGHSAVIARLLNVSDRIAKLLCEAPEAEDVRAVCTDAASFIGVELGVLAKLMLTIENDIEELADVLRIDVIPGDVYALVANTLQEQIGVPATG